MISAQERVLSVIGNKCDRVDELPDPPDDPWRAPDVRWVAGLVRESINARPYDHDRFLEALANFLERLPKEELAAGGSYARIEGVPSLARRVFSYIRRASVLAFTFRFFSFVFFFVFFFLRDHAEIDTIRGDSTRLAPGL